MVWGNLVRRGLSQQALGIYFTPFNFEQPVEYLWTLFLPTSRHRFNRVAWGYANASRERGIIAAGMENGELGLWDPEKILVNAGYVIFSLLRRQFRRLIKFEQHN